MSGEWLGHRDLCPSQSGLPCDCPCSDIACPGVDRCQDPDCSLARMFLAPEEDR